MSNFLTNDSIGKGVSFKSLALKIKDDFFDKAGFATIFAMLLLFFAREINELFGIYKYDVFSMFYYVIGSIAGLLSIIYIFRYFCKNDSIRVIIKNIKIWDIFFGFMMIWAFISTLFSNHFMESFYGYDNTFFLLGYTVYLVYASIYVCSRIIKSEKYKLCIYRLISIIGAFSSFTTIIQVIDSNYLYKIFPGAKVIINEYSGLFINVNFFGYLMSITIISSVVLIFIERKLWSKFVWLVLYGIQLWALLLNNTLGGFVAIFITIIFVCIFGIIRDKKNWIWILLIIGILIGNCIYAEINTNYISSNFNILSHDVTHITDDSAGSNRMVKWKNAFKGIKKYPLTGYGTSMYSSVFNEYIEHTVEWGIPGGFLYIAAIFSMFLTGLLKVKKLNKYTLAAGLIAMSYLISGFFGFTVYYITFMLPIILGIFSNMNTESEDSNEHNN